MSFLLRYYKLKERVVECEQVILRTFVFDVETTHPFAYYLNACKSLHVKTETVQVGWAILVDSYVFGKRNAYSFSSLAVSAIYLALRMVNDPSPLREEWWLLFDEPFPLHLLLMHRTSDLVVCCNDLLTMYD